MKKYTILFLFLLLSPLLSAQSPITFYRNGYGAGGGMIFENEQGYNAFLSYYYNDYLRIDIDTLGNVVNNFTYGGTNQEHSSDAIYKPNNGYLLLGHTFSYSNTITTFKAYAVKTDIMGNEQWAKTYYFPDVAERNTRFYRGIATSDGGFLLGGEACCDSVIDSTDWMRPALYLVKTDSVGTQQWVLFDSTLVDTEGFYYNISLMESPLHDGYYVATRDVDSTLYPQGWGNPFQYDNYYLAKIGLNGNYIWKKRFYPTNMTDYHFGMNYMFMDMIPTKSNTMILLGDKIVMEVDLAGNELWRNEHDFNFFNGRIIAVPDGGYLVSARDKLFRLDSGGNVIWEKQYNVTHFRAVKPTKDGGFIALAHYGIIIKTDCEGNIVNPISVCSPLGLGTNLNPTKVQYYPNPTKGLLKVNSQNPILSLEILEMAGKSILKIDTHQQIEWEGDVSLLPKGVYILNLHFDNGTQIQQKLVVE